MRRPTGAAPGPDLATRADPSGMSPTKALDDIGTALHAQYQRWESKSKVGAPRAEAGRIGAGLARDAAASMPFSYF